MFTKHRKAKHSLHTSQSVLAATWRFTIPSKSRVKLAPEGASNEQANSIEYRELVG